MPFSSLHAMDHIPNTWTIWETLKSSTFWFDSPTSLIFSILSNHHQGPDSHSPSTFREGELLPISTLHSHSGYHWFLYMHTIPVGSIMLKVKTSISCLGEEYFVFPFSFFFPLFFLPLFFPSFPSFPFPSLLSFLYLSFSSSLFLFII